MPYMIAVSLEMSDEPKNGAAKFANRHAKFAAPNVYPSGWLSPLKGGGSFGRTSPSGESPSENIYYI